MKTNKQTIKPPKPSAQPYSFPVQSNESLFFSAKDGFIAKAVISVNGTDLSILMPTYDSKYKDPDIADVAKTIRADECDHALDAPEIELDFFGGVPFHCSLLGDCQLKVTLWGFGKLPSLTLQSTVSDESNVSTINHTWESLKSSEYCEHVTVGSNSGEKKLILVYTPKGCGYRDV